MKTRPLLNTEFPTNSKSKISLFRSKKAKGLSTVVAVVLMVLLVVVATGIVWGVVKNLVQENLGEAESCFDVGFSDKVSINNDYTCYDSDNNNVNFSISIGDIEIEELLVSISWGGSSKSFVITNEAQEIAGLRNLNGSLNVILPGKNSGLTYVATGISATEIDWIKISPKVNGKQCEVSDTVYELDDCKLFV